VSNHLSWLCSELRLQSCSSAGCGQLTGALAVHDATAAQWPVSCRPAWCKQQRLVRPGVVTFQYVIPPSSQCWRAALLIGVAPCSVTVTPTRATAWASCSAAASPQQTRRGRLSSTQDPAHKQRQNIVAAKLVGHVAAWAKQMCYQAGRQEHCIVSSSAASAHMPAAGLQRSCDACLMQQAAAV
jgi:hypothetical protein